MKRLLLIYIIILFSSCSVFRHVEKHTQELKTDSVAHTDSVAYIVTVNNDQSTIETTVPGDTASATLPNNQNITSVVTNSGTTIVAYKDSTGTHIKVITAPKHTIEHKNISQTITSHTQVTKDSEVKKDAKVTDKTSNTKSNGITRWLSLLWLIPVGFLIWRYWKYIRKYF